MWTRSLTGTTSDLNRELRRMRDRVDRMMPRLWQSGTSEGPPLRAWSSDQGVTITAELPGVAPEALDISVADDTFTLKVDAPVQELAEGVKVLRRECSRRSLSRSVRLPYRVAADQVEASLVAGVLTVVLPKSPEEHPRKIDVTTVAGGVA